MHAGGDHSTNGDIERTIRTIIEATTAAMQAASAPIKYWPEAMQNIIMSYNDILARKLL